MRGRAWLTCALALLALLAPVARAGVREDVRTLLAAALAERDANGRERVAARARELERTASFESLIAALREGPLVPSDALEPRAGEELARFGRTAVGYRFESGGTSYRYAIDLPPKYDGERACGLLLDPGHGSAKDAGDDVRADMLSMYRRHADAAGLGDWIVVRTEIVEEIGAGGRRGAKPDDEVALVFQDLFRALATRVRFDPDRVVVTGLSQTGYWSWYLGRFRADRFAGIAPMSAISRVPADAYLANFLALPTYVLQGDRDPLCGVEGPRATCARLALLGAPAVYAEIAGGAHDYAVWKHQPEALEWIARRPRERCPRRVSKSVQTALDGWCYWVRIDGLERRGDGRAANAPTGGVDGELDGQTVRLFSDGVEALTVGLSSQMLDLSKPVRIEWNGKLAYAGVVERSFAAALAFAAEKADWSGLFEASVRLSE